MRIAIFSWETVHSVYVGGVSNHVTELASALERKGHEVHIFTRMGRPNHLQYERIFGVHYHRCPFESKPDFIEEINEMCRAFVNAFLAAEDLTGKFDIIHAHDWLAANAVIWIKEARGHKTVFTIHSTEYGRCGNNFYGGNSERIRQVEWNAGNHADHIIAVSRTLQNEYQKIYGVPDWKIDVIYNGINSRHMDGYVDPAPIRAKYGIGPMDPMVLFAGRMVDQKGPDLLVQSISSILKFYNNAKFVFAGDGEMKPFVENLANNLGVADACRFLGYQGGENLKNLFKACDCVCVPSRNEPFGIVVLEAWSAGKPVVATINGGPSEIVWHEVNGYKIYPNPESIAWGIGTTFEDFEHAKWMGRNGRIAAESVFSWDTIAEETLAIYEC
ncbi:MAG: glycosyltransferase family 4 protein [Candidatus Omnitrophica bacterium]|nr:glycosyltransferase family 4 protein [Candidatus Omnitrophota bacterium]